MPPTERSRYPTRSAWVCAMDATIRGSARMRICDTLVALTNPGNRELVYQSNAATSRTWSTTGIHSRNRTILRHLFLSRASRMTFRTASRAASTRSLMAPRSRRRLRHREPERRPSRLGQPGPSHHRLDDAQLVELVAGDLLDDLAPGHDEHPIAQPGELDGVARLDEQRRPAVRAGAQRLVDVEAGADVDALRRLVGEDHRRLLEEAARHRDLLLVPPGEELDRLLERWRPDLQLFDEVGDGASLRPPPEEAEHGEPAQRLDGACSP